MDPIYPWLDPVEVRRLADRLMRPTREPVVTVTEAGFGDAFIGFASDQPLADAPVSAPTRVTPEVSQIPPPLPPQVRESVPQSQISSPAAVPQPAPAPQAARPVQPEPVAAPPFIAVPPTTSQPAENRATTARGPFLDKITRFRDWMRHNFSATGIFILDREGSVIFDESSHGRLHFMARSLALASRRPGASTGNVHVKIGADATLEVIPVDTAYGCLVLGAVVSEPLDPPSVNAVMEALAQVASPPADNT